MNIIAEAKETLTNDFLRGLHRRVVHVGKRCCIACLRLSVAQRVLPALGKVIMQVFDQPVHDSSRQLVGNYGRNCQHEDR